MSGSRPTNVEFMFCKSLSTLKSQTGSRGAFRKKQKKQVGVQNTSRGSYENNMKNQCETTQPYEEHFPTHHKENPPQPPTTTSMGEFISNFSSLWFQPI